MKQLLLDILPATEPSLANFVAGANLPALSATTALAGGQTLYLWGGAGSGRSHLLQAKAAASGGLYLDATAPAHALQALAHDDQQPPTLVAIDDIHLLDSAGQAALFSLFNRWRISAGNQAGAAHTAYNDANTEAQERAGADAFAILLAGERAPLQLQIREDLRSRLGWGLVIRLHQLSDNERSQALLALAAQRGLTLPAEVLNWLLSHYSRDMRALSALLDALDKYSLARHRAITIPLLKELLGSSPP